MEYFQLKYFLMCFSWNSITVKDRASLGRENLFLEVKLIWNFFYSLKKWVIVHVVQRLNMELDLQSLFGPWRNMEQPYLSSPCPL